jgi:hypothetical protein
MLLLEFPCRIKLSLPSVLSQLAVEQVFQMQVLCYCIGVFLQWLSAIVALILTGNGCV